MRKGKKSLSSKTKTFFVNEATFKISKKINENCKILKGSLI